MPKQKSSSSLPLIITCLLLLAVLVVAAVWTLGRSSAPTPPAVAENPFIFGGLPRATEAAAQYALLTNRAYIAGYSEARRDPLFTAYHLKGLPRLTSDKRPGKFSPDARTAAHITTEDYTRSGYDRGHMSPNHVIDVYFGADAQLETFLMSNVVPQRHTLNAGVWEKIEMLEADTYEPKFGEMWVIIGPVFGATPEVLTDGVQVPEACFRIWVRQEQGTPHVLAFVCPNEGLTGKEQPEGYIATVKEIEERTHLDFFEAEPAGEKARLEEEKTGLW